MSDDCLSADVINDLFPVGIKTLKVADLSE